MSKRYDQYCPVAHALGLVGERWALLIVRELLHGPQRYTDLTASLPKIGTNILSSRLKDLEAGGIVVKRRLPPPAASQVYELTEYGHALKPVVRMFRHSQLCVAGYDCATERVRSQGSPRGGRVSVTRDDPQRLSVGVAGGTSRTITSISPG